MSKVERRAGSVEDFNSDARNKLSQFARKWAKINDAKTPRIKEAVGFEARLQNKRGTEQRTPKRQTPMAKSWKQMETRFASASHNDITDEDI
eukprot:gene16136-4892_t